jgi:hypothetical protein
VCVCDEPAPDVPTLVAEWALIAFVFVPPVSSATSKSVSFASCPTMTLPAPNAAHVPRPRSVFGFVERVEV